MIGTSHLAELKPAQRKAVEYGVASRGPNVAGPLLMIAGAGSGKTNTLAHRVAHLLIHGADPGRILLLTFSRRAAAEMEDAQSGLLPPRAAKSPSPAGARSAGRAHSTPWARGSCVPTRGSIGLDPGFTVHDREDSGDLINLVRHECGLSEKAKRFPLKGTCLAIYSRAVNAAEPLDVVLRKQFPWCAEWEDDLRHLFEAYVEAKQKQHVLDYHDLLLYWGELMQVPEIAGEIGALFDHVRARDRLMGQRTALINQLRGLLMERGIVAPQGRRKLEGHIDALMAEQVETLSRRIRLLVAELRSEWRNLDRRIAAFDDEFTALARSDETTHIA